jgi:hypothetical protein
MAIYLVIKCALQIYIHLRCCTIGIFILYIGASVDPSASSSSESNVNQNQFSWSAPRARERERAQSGALRASAHSAAAEIKSAMLDVCSVCERLSLSSSSARRSSHDGDVLHSNLNLGWLMVKGYISIEPQERTALSAWLIITRWWSSLCTYIAGLSPFTRRCCLCLRAARSLSITYMNIILKNTHAEPLCWRRLCI